METSHQDKKGFAYLMALMNQSPIKNPLFDFRNSLTPMQSDYIKALDASCHQLILKEHLPILKKFYVAKQQEQSPLGELYRHMSFEQMLARFIKARYEAAYQDGRLLVYRSEHDDLVKPMAELTDREKLLLVGSPEDKGRLVEHYLSIEESALSHLISANGYFLPLSNGLRYNHNGMLPFFRPGDISRELESAHPGPVHLNYAVGPELREGQSLHYDALMCIEYADEEPGHPHYERRIDALHKAGFSAVAEDLYGLEYPQGPKPRAACQTIPFKVGGGAQATTAYFYVNAYKTRLRHTLKQILLSNELYLPEPGTVRLKGLGLGAFGVHSLESSLENIYKEVLNDLLNTLPLKKINKIELINFPSLLKTYDFQPGDLQCFMEYGQGISKPATDIQAPIEVEQVLTPCLSNAEDTYLSTQICGDSISLPGNEGVLGLPPSSSDEASMYYALGGLKAMRDQANLQSEDLAKKIIVTDGVHCKKLNGKTTKLDLSAVKPTPLKAPITLKVDDLPHEKAVAAMDHANATRGVVSSIKQEKDNRWSTLITIDPRYDRDRFFGLSPVEEESESPEMAVNTSALTCECGGG